MWNSCVTVPDSPQVGSLQCESRSRQRPKLFVLFKRAQTESGEFASNLAAIAPLDPIEYVDDRSDRKVTAAGMLPKF
ncbi:hypothetical protein H6F67_05915 [Microcoleus sp. FACHB-1515]|uniref:hypothetical protein n=1 Tax=Cyanophyceae TaxID=3028117 RepID=UPI0016848DF0|nr:hypothetical protein [Microcoleus sp. FACHB-1515]MBD2089386.1 hypothetical protein [Microcoleus sp. FACHB-1515]